MTTIPLIFHHSSLVLSYLNQFSTDTPTSLFSPSPLLYFCLLPSWPGNVQTSYSYLFSNLAYSRNCSLLANILHSKCRWDWPSGGSAACCRWRRWAFIHQLWVKKSNWYCTCLYWDTTDWTNFIISLTGKGNLHITALCFKNITGETVIEIRLN